MGSWRTGRSISAPPCLSRVSQRLCSKSNRILFFFFYVPGHARSSVRWVRRSPQSAAVSQQVPKASCGHPLDWAMSGVSKLRRWGRTAGCSWGFEDLCRMEIRLNEKFSVCGGGRGVDSVQFSDWKLWLELLCQAGGCCPLLSQCLGVVATPSWSCFLGWPCFAIAHGCADSVWIWTNTHGSRPLRVNGTLATPFSHVSMKASSTIFTVLSFMSFLPVSTKFSSCCRFNFPNPI